MRKSRNTTSASSSTVRRLIVSSNVLTLLATLSGLIARLVEALTSFLWILSNSESLVREIFHSKMLALSTTLALKLQIIRQNYLLAFSGLIFNIVQQFPRPSVLHEFLPRVFELIEYTLSSDAASLEIFIFLVTSIRILAESTFGHGLELLRPLARPLQRALAIEFYKRTPSIAGELPEEYEKALEEEL